MQRYVDVALFQGDKLVLTILNKYGESVLGRAFDYALGVSYGKVILAAPEGTQDYEGAAKIDDIFAAALGYLDEEREQNERFIRSNKEDIADWDAYLRSGVTVDQATEAMNRKAELQRSINEVSSDLEEVNRAFEFIYSAQAVVESYRENIAEPNSPMASFSLVLEVCA